MANTLLTPDQITRKFLQVLHNKLVLTRTVNRQYDDSFAQSGAKIGDTLRIRLPNRYVVSDGATLVVQDTNEKNTSLKVDKQKHVGLRFTINDLTLHIDEFSARYIEPAATQLASSVDADVATAFKYIGQSVGTPGTTPATSAVILAATRKLDEGAVDRMNRYAAVNPAANAELVEGMKGFFNPQGVISKQFKNGLMGEGILGLDEFNMTQSIKQFTTGSRGATGTTGAAVAAQGATTVSLAGLGANKTVKHGDVFTVAGVYAINPETRESTGSLFQFVVLADATADGAGAADVTVRDIYSADAVGLSDKALATVDTLPGNGAVVTFLGAASTQYAQNLIYHKDAITFASADLVLPQGVDMASRATHDGISLRLVRDYDINEDRMNCRVDVLYGHSVIRPEMAVRLWG